MNRILIIATSLVFAGCSRAPATAAVTAPATATPATKTADKANAEHPLKGVVTDLLPERGSLMVKHEEIPGFMPAMTMGLKVEPEVLKAAVKGQSLTATIYRKDGDFWLRDVKLAALPSPAPVTASAAAAPSAGTPGKADAGKGVYMRVCFVCHQATGLGVPSVFPPLAGAEQVVDKPERVIAIVLHGLQGPIKVKGVNYTNVMPPHAAQLKDQEIADVLTYVRSEWGNKADAITVEAVAKMREAYKGRTAMWTWAELEKL